MNWLVYFVLLGAVLMAGWEHPLRYRFMSPEQIQALEAPSHPNRISPKERAVAWQPQGTSLDRAPYKIEKNGQISYSEVIDQREMGTRTEQARRANIYGGKGVGLYNGTGSE